MGDRNDVPKLERLRRIRESRFMTQAELADKSGVSRQTINRLEHGEIDARFKTMRQLAETLGVQPGALAGPVVDDAFVAACEDLAWDRAQLAAWLGVEPSRFEELAAEPRPRMKSFMGADGRPTMLAPPAGWEREMAIRYGADVERFKLVLAAI